MKFRPLHNHSTQKDNSMFKNVMIYRVVNAPTSIRVGTVALNFQMFTPCGATQAKSSGWVSPRGEEHGALMETIGGQHILKLMTETKAVPAAVVNRKVDDWAANIEESEGRKPGKKERRELKEDALLALLPHAFPKQHATLIWIDPVNDLLVIDASSQGKADDAVTMLIKSFDGLVLQLVNTNISPVGCMAQWLVEREPTHSFTIDRECELKATDESKAVVKYGRHPLDIEEVAQHIAMGKMPTKLALTYDDRVSFVLTDGMALKKIQILDVAFEDHYGPNNPEPDHFDADVAIATGELAKLIPNLIAALGGEVEAA